MKHYKEGRKHILELGSLSIKIIILTQKEYNELKDYFKKQDKMQLKNLAGNR